MALDGTKVQASASKHKAMSYKRMVEEEEHLEEERLEDEIQEMIEEAEATDREEDDRFGRENRGDELPEELGRRRDRLQTIQKAKADLKKEAKRGRAEEV